MKPIHDKKLWDSLVANYSPTAKSPQVAVDTPNGCVSLGRLMEGMEKGRDKVWTDTEKKHISGCHTCQGYIRMHWKIEKSHPSNWDLFCYLLLGSQLELYEAVNLHIRKDRCMRCFLGSEHPLFIRAADLILRSEKTLEWAEGILEGLVFLFVPAPRLAFGQQAAARHSHFFQEEKSMDESLSVAVLEKEEGLTLNLNQPAKTRAAGIQSEYGIVTHSGELLSGTFTGGENTIKKPAGDSLILVGTKAVIAELNSAASGEVL